jgi:putative ATPase
MRGLGYGRDYRYSHDFADDDPKRWTQAYLPENIQSRRFYEPGNQGFEAEDIAPRLAKIRDLGRDEPNSPDAAERTPPQR